MKRLAKKMNERKKQRRLVPRLIVVPLSSHYLDEDDIEIEQENDGFIIEKLSNNEKKVTPELG